MDARCLVSSAIVIVSATTACVKEPVAEGGECARRWECNGSLSCIGGICKPSPGEGGACDNYDVVCQTGLVCDHQVCRTLQGAGEEQQRRDREQARRLMEQSGIDPEQAQRESSAVEAPVAPPGPGHRVRVSRTEGVARGFASCRQEERLLGGACESKGQITRSVPDRFGPEDTVGARWVCEVNAPVPVVSYALCQSLR